MKFCFVGLGNPGKEYENTRHNVGFLIIDKISFHLGIKRFNNFEKQLLWASISLDKKIIYLVKPYSYMNNSGIPLRDFCRYKNINVDELILIYDDVDIKIGKIKIKKDGSSGGHKGVQSIIDSFGTSDIKRIRVGIGPKPKDVDLSCYVLSPFKKEEVPLLNSVVDRMKEIFESIVNRGIDYAISRYNSNF